MSHKINSTTKVGTLNNIALIFVKVSGGILNIIKKTKRFGIFKYIIAE